MIRGLGVQTRTNSGLWGGGGRTRFIPTSAIQDVFIHEAFRGFEVVFYLGIVVGGEEGVVVVFPVSLHARPFVRGFWLLMCGCWDRIYCRGGKFWRRFGGARGGCCMSPRLEFGILSIRDGFSTRLRLPKALWSHSNPCVRHTVR